MDELKPWVYSHTQLDLWRTCKRRYHWRYELGHKEPTTDNMAAGTWLVQNPIEDFHHQEFHPHTYWPNFIAEFGGKGDYDGPIFTPDIPQKTLIAYKANPVVGNVVDIERTFEIALPGGTRYSSRPDLVVERFKGGEMVGDGAGGQIQTKEFQRVVWDIKLKTFNQARNGDEFFLKPTLSPLDDQGISQAVCAGAEAFGQIQFWLGKKDGLLRGPFYLEHPLNPVLAREWKWETAFEIDQITALRDYISDRQWPKNPDSCNKFGRVCPAWDACNFGFVGKQLDKENKSA